MLFLEKGEPAARRGRKATDLHREAAGLPEGESPCRQSGRLYSREGWSDLACHKGPGARLLSPVTSPPSGKVI